jgi:3-oxoacyl-[acyl-carrier protein] reductase
MPAKQPQRLKGKVALVTGAAQGIGLAIASRLAEQGAVAILSDIQEKAGHAAAKTLRNRKLKAHFVPMDLRREEDIRAGIDRTIKEEGRLDIVVNNARPKLHRGPYAETLNEWDLAMDVLLKAPALLAKHAFQSLSASGGTLINVLSTNAFFISHQPAAYHVAKAGLAQLTRFLSCEFGPYGIRVNAISPAMVDVEDRHTSPSDTVRREITRVAIPLRRTSTPVEVADALIFLCTPESAYINGHVLILDAGLSHMEQFHVGTIAYQHVSQKGAAQ